MQVVAVATDFSVRSDRALLRAKLIARRTGARLVILHVVDEDQPPRLVSANKEAALSLLTATTQTLQVQDGIVADLHIVVADVPTGILIAADEVGADLIVVGPHRKRLTDIFTGTTVERVVRRSIRPLLVAVETPTKHHLRALLAVDFEESSKVAARKALELGIFDHTDVIVMHAFDVPAEGMMRRSMVATDAIDHYRTQQHAQSTGQLRDMLAELGLPPSTTRLAAITGTPANTILEVAKEEKADLIIVGTSQRQGFERLLIGSVTTTSFARLTAIS